MAYRAIQDAELGVDAPLDEALVTALRDNCIAIPQGLSGAPKVELDALADPSGGATFSGELTVENLGYNKLTHDMDTIFQLHNWNNTISGFSTPQITTFITSQGYTIEQSGDYSLVISAWGSDLYLGALTVEILIDDVAVSTDVAQLLRIYGPNIVALDVIRDFNLTAGQVVKLKTTGNTLAGTTSGFADSYYGVILNFVTTNYMGEPANMGLRASTSGTYNSTQPTTTYLEQRIVPHPRVVY